MAAHSYIWVGHQPFLACRESYLPELASAFRDNELSTDADAPIYEVSARELRERLEVLGYSTAAARRHLDRAFRDVLQYDEEAQPLDEWLEEAGNAIRDDDAATSDVPMWAGFEEPRHIVRLLVDRAPDDATVQFDIADVISRGYSKWRPDLCEQAFDRMREEGRLAPLIVLTEGSSDAEFLATSIKMLAPHLDDYVRFLDWDFKPEGSASALVRAVRAFAAAGITNRVVALFDNDAAAAEALTTLETRSLPANFRVLQLPRLELAAHYPTMGPTGPHEMDVNGLAVSIELFLGQRSLRPIGDSDMLPVQWRGYMNKVKRYQGEVMDKPRIHDAFRARAHEVLRDGAEVQRDEFPEMELLLQAVAYSFAEGGSPGPTGQRV